MSDVIKEISPLELKRREIKVQIPFRLVQPIADYVSQWCHMDAFSGYSSDGFYTINSLYLDTEDMRFLQNKRDKLVSRYSMRVRSYGDEPKAPYFFEVKEKNRDFVRKRRAKVFSEDWAQIFTDGHFPEGCDYENDAHLRHFVNIVWAKRAEPKLLTRYRRLAFISDVDNYARVTFDRDLGFQLENKYNVKPDRDKLVNYDLVDYFLPDCNVVLELKCERQVPFWMVNLIKKFELIHGSFSKYESSWIESHEAGPDVSSYSDLLFRY